MAVCKKCGYPIDTTASYVNGQAYHKHCADDASELGKNKSIKGTVKWFSNDKGYGFILVPGKADDIFFHISEYKSKEVIQNGDKVSFEIGIGRKNKPAAKNVHYLCRADKQQNNKPYYGKPTKTEVGVVGRAGNSLLGMIVGNIILGPLGTIIGGVLGLAADTSQEITSTCLRCGGTGQVTAIDEDFIGFQCEECKAYWKKRNKDNLTMSSLKRDS